MNLVVQTEGSAVSLGIDPARTLGRGATATVYEVEYLGRKFAAKIYFDRQALPLPKLREMTSFPPTGIAMQLSGREYPLVAWPQQLLFQDGSAVGFLMPAIDPSHCFPLDYYFDRTLFGRLGSASEAALSYRLAIAASLGRLVAGLHAQGVHLIDIKPHNIRVLRGIHVVTLVDCDGFSVPRKSGGRFPAELISSDYVAPEAFRNHTPPAALGEEQDRYALAVVMFQLLNNGTHPFQGVSPDFSQASATNDERAAAGLYPYGLTPSAIVAPRRGSFHECWPDATRQLFDRAFLAQAAADRPSAAEWADHFEGLLRDKALVRCQVSPNDIRHMRFKDKPCAGCVDEERASAETTFVPFAVATPAGASGETRWRNSAATQPNTVAGRPAGWLIALLLLLLPILAFVAYARGADDDAYAKARSLNTEAAYNSYLFSYPNGLHKDAAKADLARIASLELYLDRATYQEAERLNTRSAFQNYLSVYPNGESRWLAEGAIKRLSKVTVSLCNESGYTAYAAIVYGQGTTSKPDSLWASATFRAEGWFKLAHGQCVERESTSENFYTYASSNLGEWGGDQPFCINRQDRFDYYPTTTTQPAYCGPPYSTAYFKAHRATLGTTYPWTLARGP
jgi:hypothetical protein